MTWVSVMDKKRDLRCASLSPEACCGAHLTDACLKSTVLCDGEPDSRPIDVFPFDCNGLQEVIA